ncbi:metal ABC transporter ATP-binding protein [Patulibacter defluvii]|uniref:metal ABC transporter ATP-binding protein n=1 Tax=Patulibacter defluvii TaxID=3095358 RepID=UPI002A750CC0|nr:metal ABC transporter ATP-binding protein [Patulibacter sp. DM4]
MQATGAATSSRGEPIAAPAPDPTPIDGVAQVCGHGDGADADGRPLVELDGVAVGYDQTLALREVGFRACAGERIAILGPNGGGKTTLFRTVLGELPVREGRMTLRDEVAVVPQTERSRLDFPVSALDVVLMGTIAHRPWWRGPGRGERQKARAALRAVGLEDRAEAGFGALSGGQRQRVLVARALVRDSRILLFDEPFTGLDTASSERLQRLIDDLAAAGHLLLIATHDVAQARGWDRVLCLNGRQVAFGEPATTLTPETLQATYGHDLVRLGDGDAVAVVCDHRHG